MNTANDAASVTAPGRRPVRPTAFAHPGCRALAISAALALASVIGHAAEKDDLTQQKEIEQLRKEIAEARKATAEAEAAEAKAKLGTLSSTPPSGQASDLKAEAQLLAYAAVDEIAAIIAAEVKQATRTTEMPVVLYSVKDLNAIVQARAVLRNVQDLEQAMKGFRVEPLAAENAACKEPTTAGATLPVLDALSILQTLLKVNKVAAGSSFTLEEFALSAAVLRRLRQAGFKSTVYPSMYFPSAFADPNKDPIANSQIARGVAGLNDRLRDVDLQLADIAKRAKAVEERAADKKRPLPDACPKEFADAKVRFETATARGTALKVRANAIIAGVAAIDENTGATTLQSLAQAEALSKGHPGAHLLQVRTVAAGATTLTKTNFFTTNFYVSGSAVVAYMLTDPGGSVVGSGVVGQQGGNGKLSDLRQSLQAQRAALNAQPPRD